MAKTMNTSVIIFSILLIPLTIFWLYNFLHNYSSILEKLCDDDLGQVVQATFLPVIKQLAINEKDHKAVVTLTEKNFSSFVAENEYVMVNIYSPWSYWNQKLALEYEAAALSLSKDDGVVFAKVDAYTESQLAWKYRISGYSKLIWFAGGIPKPYYGNRTRDDLVRWVRKSIAGVPIIRNINEAEHVLDKDFTKVVGFYDTLEGPDSKELFVASKWRPDIKFYQTVSPEVARVFHIDLKIKHPVLVQLRKEDEDFRQFVGSFTGFEIAHFLSTDIQPHYTEDRVPVEYPRKKSFETEVMDQSYWLK